MIQHAQTRRNLHTHTHTHTGKFCHAKTNRFGLFLIPFLILFYANAHATTVNMNWVVDGEDFAQTTCETGNSFSLPNPAPTKYGYTFVGWTQNVLSGTWEQSGTPTPTNPIYPVFYQMGDTVLRAVGNGNDLIADTYNPATQTITRNIGVRVFDGTENWDIANAAQGKYYFVLPDGIRYSNRPALFTHFTDVATYYTAGVNNGQASVFTTGADGSNLKVTMCISDLTSLDLFKQFLAGQYAAGTPVTVYYPLATPVVESYVPSAQ